MPLDHKLRMKFSRKEKDVSQAQMPREQVLELGRRWAKAERESDAETLGQLLDPDFVCVGPVGFVIDKEQYLAGRRSGDLTSRVFDWDVASVRVYGDAAIAVGTQTQTGTFRGRDASARLRATQVLIRKGGDWLIASLHLSAIAPAPAWIIGALQAGPPPSTPDRPGGAQ
jgi:ketosteroid isomerase-like protein